MDFDNIETYIQSIEDTAADMRAALDNAVNGNDADYDQNLEHVRDFAQQIEGHALDILQIISDN